MTSSVTDLLPRVCEFYGLGPPLRFADAGGYANRNLFIETEKGAYLVKILREHSPDELVAEAHYLERIALTGFPSPTYLVGHGGDYLFEIDDQFVALQPFFNGDVVDTLSLARIASLGTALARLHLIDCGALPVRNTWWHTDFLVVGLVHAKDRFGDQVMMKLESDVAALADLGLEKLPTGIVHGDPWPGNAVFNGPRLAALVDWEETTIGCPVFDLAYLAMHACLQGGALDAKLFESLIASYQSVRKLSDCEHRYFGQVVQRVACTNYLWLLLRDESDGGELDTLWPSQWYRDLELERLTFAD